MNGSVSPQSAINNLQIIVVGGIGLVMTSVFSTFASSLGHNATLRVFSSLVSYIILLVGLYFIFRIATFNKVSKRNLLFCAVISAVGLQVLQSIGGYIITHELKHFDSLYGASAIVLGLLFWIYLQAQVVLYTVEIGTVRALKLWPRSIDIKNQTPADAEAYRHYFKREQFKQS